MVVALGASACSSADADTPDEVLAALTTRIAFASCMHQSKPKPVLDLALASQPQRFLFLGDNLYGDTDDMAVLQADYDELATSPELARLRAAVPTYAIWDDHDYGRNDAGEEYPFKAESKAIFLDFWEEPADSPRFGRDGLYGSYVFDEPGGTVRVIFLDMRWFRDPLDPNTDPAHYKHDYMPTSDTSRTMLGEAQWAWLADELAQPADVRIVASSIQFGHEYNGWESWTNMPHELERMVDLVASTGAEATIFVSGDVHWGELSKLETPSGHPLYDLTSSGITETWPSIDTNAHRIGEPVAENNFGIVDIAWDAAGGPAIVFRLVDVAGVERLRHVVALSELVL